MCFYSAVPPGGAPPEVSGRGAAFRGRSRATHGACHRGGPGLRPQGGSTGLMRRRARESRSRILRVPAPGHWRGPGRATRLADGLARPPATKLVPGGVRATALKAHPSRSARPKTKAPRAGCRGRFAVMAAGPVPALYSSARGPSALRTARPPRSPLILEGRATRPAPQLGPERVARTITHALERRRFSLTRALAPMNTTRERWA